MHSQCRKLLAASCQKVPPPYLQRTLIGPLKIAPIVTRCQTVKPPKAVRPKHGRRLTGRYGHAPLQAGASRADLVGSALPHGPHGELEGAAGDVLAAVLDVDGVRADLLRDEAHAVRAAAAVHDVGVHRLAAGAGHLGRHGLGAALNWGGGGVDEHAFRDPEDARSTFFFFKAGFSPNLHVLAWR